LIFLSGKRGKEKRERGRMECPGGEWGLMVKGSGEC